LRSIEGADYAVWTIAVLLNFEYEELFFENDGIRLHAVAAGPKLGPVIILLHGFPEFWYGWRKQIGPLAAAGFRVVALDQRGYNLSSKPVAVSDYAAPLLTRDVVRVADQLGCDRFYLAGHDWGAAVAWALALQYPERLHKLAILNVPHPAVMMHRLRTNPQQWLRSWYILFFQLPWLPEAALSACQFYLGAHSLLGSSRPGAFTVGDLEVYRTAWSQPGALSATINWYRALIRHRPRIDDLQVHTPTRILWGQQDRFLLSEMAQKSLRYCDSAELTFFPDATHWVQHEEVERVNQSLIEFFNH
jgi:pimeloyl-ACP methyl ester carboxylesterase